MWLSCFGGDSCTARSPHTLDAQAVLALAPFLAAFVVIDVLFARHVFPRLNPQDRDGEDHILPVHAPAALRHAHAEHGAKSRGRRGAAWAFGTTVALAATLGLLILGEILEVVDPAAKNFALHVTVPTLLFFVVVLVPWLECRAVIAGMGWSFQRTAKGRIPRIAWMLQTVLFSGWVFAFWAVGNAVPEAATTKEAPTAVETLTRATLERVAVVGICLMALLAGFASVSSPWHTFVDRASPVSDADVNRKQSGLEATTEMLASKRHQLSLLQRRVESDSKSSSLMGKVMGTFRSTSDETEVRALRIDIAGLETMEANLSSSVSMMRNRRDAAARASTTLGQLTLLPSHLFSAYCVYRVLATLLTSLRRLHAPDTTFANSDPINRLLGLVARHWDPKLDQLAWARTISFALSGVILLASANSVVQTFHLFAKWTPGLLRHAQANLALAVGQVAATYVISASLLMRSQLPQSVGGAVTGVLHAALSPAFVDRWFETCFLVGSVGTAFGIWLGRKLSFDDYEDMGAKRS